MSKELKKEKRTDHLTIYFSRSILQTQQGVYYFSLTALWLVITSRFHDYIELMEFIINHLNLRMWLLFAVHMA